MRAGIPALTRYRYSGIVMVQIDYHLGEAEEGAYYEFILGDARDPTREPVMLGYIAASHPRMVWFLGINPMSDIVFDMVATIALEDYFDPDKGLAQSDPTPKDKNGKRLISRVKTNAT